MSGANLTTGRRSILHVDLDPFFVSVERSLDPSLRARPLIVGAGLGGAPGTVAAASTEARARGVLAGQSLAKARALCPEAVCRAGDFETYARVSGEVTSVLAAASRRVERPSVDEAFVDLTSSSGATAPVALAEAIKDELQRRLGLDAALGLASSRLAARVASRWARPHGLLVVLPGYEATLLNSEPIEALPDLPRHVQAALLKGGLATLGAIGAASEADLLRLVGPAFAQLVRQEFNSETEAAAIPVSAPPAWVHEEATVRSPHPELRSLHELLETLLSRALRRLRPFGLTAGGLAVEVRRGDGRRQRARDVPVCDAGQQEAELRGLARALAEPLLEPAGGVRALQVRLTRLHLSTATAPLHVPTTAQRQLPLQSAS